MHWRPFQTDLRRLRAAAATVVAALLLALTLFAGGPLGTRGTARDAESAATRPEVRRAVEGSHLPRSTWEAAPAEIGDRTERWIERFLGPQRATFQIYLEREGEFADLIRSELDARGMPDEVLYLAMMESGFSPNAVSHASATGVWQFMVPTARAYGLRVDEWVDERRDPVRATHAALDYLEDLYDRFGSWHLAAAAYNAGPTRVARALRRKRGVADERLYWAVMQELPRETREYVPRILAARILAEDPAGFGFEVERAAPYRYGQVLVPPLTRLAEVAETLGMTPGELRRLNPHFVRGVTPPGSAFAVRVPEGRAGQVVAALSAPANPAVATS